MSLVSSSKALASRALRVLLTLGEGNNIEVAHPHTRLADRLANDAHDPLAVVPRRV